VGSYKIIYAGVIFSQTVTQFNLGTHIYSKQLGFRLGANERAEGLYTQYMTDGEQVCNNAENSSAKSIIKEMILKNSWHQYFTQFLCIHLFILPSLAMAMNPTGLWESKDEKTGKKRAIIQMSMANSELQGKLIRIFKEPNDTGMCSRCPGAFKDKPIQGLTFAWGLKPTGDNSWGEGHILDPKSGKIYRAKMSLKDDNHLLVRGYLGISLLGRTQVWERVK
jgi:uncharacterized protein (DUF2147 family)